MEIKSCFGIDLIKATNESGDIKYLIKNYREVTKANVLVFNNVRLGNGLLEKPPVKRLVPGLDPVNGNDHKQRFWKRALSQMIAEVIQGQMDQVSLKMNDFKEKIHMVWPKWR